ncbi:MAG: TIGR03936 family radical SAM-associated protein [Candidatus Aquicultorales bacterium]
MAKLLLRYTKEGKLRFLSHLELAKLLTRSLRRSGLPVTISTGFHPKPRVSYGPALGLGATSTSEYIAVALDRELPLDLVVSKISSTLIEGIRVLAAEYIPEGAPSLGKAAKAASYTVYCSTDRQPAPEEVRPSAAWLFAQDDLVVEKESGVKLVKRAEAVIDADADAVEGGAEFEFLLSVGGEAGIRPGDLTALMLKQVEPPLAVTGMEIERTGLFGKVDDRFVDLMEYYKQFKER